MSSLPHVVTLPFRTRLPSRALLRVTGKDAHEFLQGLFTNDLRQLQPGGSLWGCFLFFTGRVLCDAYLYQSKHTYQDQSAILVDVHEAAATELLEHLREMKMRKKVTLEDVRAKLVVLADTKGLSAEADSTLQRHAEVFADPRAFALSAHPLPAAPPLPGQGGAAAATATAAPVPLQKIVTPAEWAPPTLLDDGVARYHSLLYANGVGEGPTVFRHNKTLPFEANTDFLHGVDFHKGCYVGQELTHRTHVMLVTRKRTVPLHFGPSATAATVPEVGDALVLDGKDRVGEVVAVEGAVGLGLLRMRYVDKNTWRLPGQLSVKGKEVGVDTFIPTWWPPKAVKKLLKNN